MNAKGTGALIKKHMKDLSLAKAIKSTIARWVLATPALPKNLKARFLMRGLMSEGRTMLSLKRLQSLYRHCMDPLLPEGSFIECGVARGGSLAVMSFASSGSRPVWGFDSFQGMPEITDEDKTEGQEWVGYKCSGPGGLEEARQTLERFYASGEWVHLVRGWFEDSFPQYAHQLAPIAVLRLDNDWYRSTRYCLETLYALVSNGGVVIIDDYHTFAGCRGAVDEFRQRAGITNPLVTTESNSEVYWRKNQ